MQEKLEKKCLPVYLIFPGKCGPKRRSGGEDRHFREKVPE